jgi:hypothetical protein
MLGGVTGHTYARAE